MKRIDSNYCSILASLSITDRKYIIFAFRNEKNKKELRTNLCQDHEIFMNLHADPDANPEVVTVNNPTNATFEITDTSLYVPVVALSTEDHNKLLDYLKRGFKKTIKWNKYRSEMSKQAKTNILNYLIDPTFNRLFN